MARTSGSTGRQGRPASGHSSGKGKAVLVEKEIAPAVNAVGASSFEVGARKVLEKLQGTIRKVIGALPPPAGGGRLSRAIDLQRALDVDAKLAWQIHKFAKASSVLPVASALPGLVAMQKFYGKAIKAGVKQELIDASLVAFQEFEGFVTDHVGDRHTFNSMVDGGQDEAESNATLNHKKAAYKAASYFMGIQTEISTLTVIFHPSADGSGMFDVAQLGYKVGVRRLRADARLMLGVVRGASDTKVKGDVPGFEPIEASTEEGSFGHMLTPFCSDPKATTVLTPNIDGGRRSMELRPGAVGAVGETNWAFGMVQRNGVVSLLDNGGVVEIASEMGSPLTLMIIDVLVPTWLPAEPATKVWTHVGSDRRVDKNQPRPPHQRMGIHESVSAIGVGRIPLERTDVPRYGEMLEYATGKLGWDLDGFRTFRCRLAYPVLGSTVTVELKFGEDFEQPGTAGK